MSTAYIGVGSNLGDRLQYIQKARDQIKAIPGVTWKKESSIYETLPHGGPAQGLYLNAVWVVESEVSAFELLSHLQRIELGLGRKRVEKNGPRTLDLDLLCYDEEVIEEDELMLPHPRIEQREFVLKPLHECNEDWVHPKTKKSVQELLIDLLGDVQLQEFIQKQKENVESPVTV